MFLDLDGTTVKSVKEGLPTEKIITAIRDASKKIKICIATGRGLWEIKNILNLLQPSGPCVILNGIQIYDPVKKKIIKEIFLKKSVIPKLSQMLKKYKTEMFYFNGTQESIYTHSHNYQNLYNIFIPNISEKTADNIIKEASQIAHVTTHKLLSPKDKTIFHVEISDSNASKMHGILEVARILKIRTHEIIGVGDGYNDFPLLMACGLKIAMGNAVPELKAIADFIAPSVEEDGVATIIEKFILNS